MGVVKLDERKSFDLSFLRWNQLRNIIEYFHEPLYVSIGPPTSLPVARIPNDGILFPIYPSFYLRIHKRI